MAEQLSAWLGGSEAPAVAAAPDATACSRPSSSGYEAFDLEPGEGLLGHGEQGGLRLGLTAFEITSWLQAEGPVPLQLDIEHKPPSAATVDLYVTLRRDDVPFLRWRPSRCCAPGEVCICNTGLWVLYTAHHCPLFRFGFHFLGCLASACFPC